MISRPELVAKDKFDPVEWLEIHKIYDPDLENLILDMKWNDRVDLVTTFITHCNLNGYDVEGNSMYYYAGPYNSYEERNTVEENIITASKNCFQLWNKGIAVFAPHLNTANFHLTQEGITIDDQVFVEKYLDCLHRFSGLIVGDRWERSSGTQGEIKKSLDIGKPIFLLSDVLTGYWRPENRRLSRMEIFSCPKIGHIQGP